MKLPRPTILLFCLGVVGVSLGVHPFAKLTSGTHTPEKPSPFGPPLPNPAFVGAWKGTAALVDRGICDLRFEITAEAPGHFEGFSSFSCTTAEPLMSKGHRPDLRAEALNLNPNAAVLTGILLNGAIQFHVVHSIGADIYACSVPAFLVTQFGSDRLAAEWKDCGGGTVLLKKVP
jgi:hypothetical protein